MTLTGPLLTVLLGSALAAFGWWLDGALGWSVLALGAVLTVFGVVMLGRAARQLGRTADAWRRAGQRRDDGP